MERAKDEWTAKNERSNSVVVPNDIADIVSMWTGVPVSQLTEEESQRLLRWRTLCISVSSVRMRLSQPLLRLFAVAVWV